MSPVKSPPTDIDWARLAVLIDGEGYIGIATTFSTKHKWSRPYLYLDVRVTNTDPRVSEWCVQHFGGKVYMGKRPSNKKWSSCFYWAVSCNKAEAVLLGCLPYFIVKRDQAEVALAFQATLDRAKTNGCNGRPVAEVMEQFRLRDVLRDLKGTSSRRGRVNKALDEYLRGVDSSAEKSDQIN